MYYLIDVERMVFCHKHSSPSLLSELSEIECAHTAVRIICSENVNDGFASFTDLELKKLYHNTTGMKWGGFSRPHLLTAVRTRAAALPITEANGYEVTIQYRSVAGDPTGCFKYARGAYKPEAIADGYEPPPLTTSATTAAAPVPDHTPAATSTQAAAFDAVATHAEQEWIKRGKPTGFMNILAIRGLILDKLTIEGAVDKPTCLASLDSWQKIKLST